GDSVWKNQNLKYLCKYFRKLCPPVAIFRLSVSSSSRSPHDASQRLLRLYLRESRDMYSRRAPIEQDPSVTSGLLSTMGRPKKRISICWGDALTPPGPTALMFFVRECTPKRDLLLAIIPHTLAAEGINAAAG